MTPEPLPRIQNTFLANRTYWAVVSQGTFNVKLHTAYGRRMKHTTEPTSRGAEHARQHLPEILAEATAGRSTIITRHGREIAAVVPVATARLPKPKPLTSLAGTGRGLWGR